MTRNEPGTPGDNQTDAHEPVDSNEPGGADAGDTRYGSMREAQDTSAQETRDGRARAAEAGDERARAEQTDAEQAGAEQADAVQADAVQTDSQRGAADDGKPDRLHHAAEWLDGKLVPRLGGAEAGPWEEESDDSVRSHDRCPLCGFPMSEHTIDRSSANAVLNCPGPQRPQPEHFEPLNEVGMIKRLAPGE